MNRPDSGRQRKLRHRKVKFFYVMQQLKGRAMNRIKVSRFFISVQLATWDSLSYNYTFCVSGLAGQQYVEVACLWQRSPVDACKSTGGISECCTDDKHGLHGQCWWSDVGAVIRVWCGCCELLLEAASDASVQVLSELLCVQPELLWILVWDFSTFRLTPSKALYFLLSSCFNTGEYFFLEWKSLILLSICKVKTLCYSKV